ncbi:hypothetical protein K443DRAFT_134214 [Laccaria amethystina LaAM-08-1]|uniref:AB hydrolase-1 domain-containing protein n=1 Tax=Laccaria amethystina LaAM-08-1 TaxID=1095629 RepID=A0A0C9X4D8_9AGAR|nr:hypothetical protein K443DRAFT_134214 [Laccaria amethystina LaAM-08-1]
MTDRTSTKLFIPHPAEVDCNLVGILEQLDPRQSTRERSIALVLNWYRVEQKITPSRHKDYLYQKRLARRLPLDSFRFDFRGNHESGGKWKQGALDEDLADVQVVVDYLKANYGYVIDLVVGHSRGSIVSFRWLCTSEDGKKVSAFVNASGRYRMGVQNAAGKIWWEHLETQESYSWNVCVARKMLTATITREDLASFISFDTSLVWDRFPHSTDAITIHGLSDKTVPPYDALIYSQALGSRTPGTHTLCLLEDADHNFTGRQDEVVDVILHWWETRKRGELKTGVLAPGVKGKL